jgi:nucleoid-associated protein EbfC
VSDTPTSDSPMFDPDELPSGMGGLDIGALLGQVQNMQQQMADAQEQAKATVLEGTSGGGKVKVTVTGAGEFTSVSIDKSVVDASDVEMLEDLVLAALRDAAVKVASLNEQSMGSITGGMGLGNLFGQ